MVDAFIQYINENQLFTPSNKILLAVSGGIDSVAMLQCFKDAAIFPFAVAHCNFGLRGEESDADEAFVKKLTKKAKVLFHSHFFETETFADQEKISIQMAARQLRYAWFSKLREDFGYDYIATAHHGNDVLETVLFNLTKGTGIAGLHGISKKSDLGIVRPILFADKQMIYDYVAEKQLTWREDKSNASVKYSRNLIRHEVIPVLKKINPDLENTFQDTVERIKLVEDFFLKGVKEIADKAIELKGRDYFINLQLLKKEAVNAAVLHEMLKTFGFNYKQSVEIFNKAGDGAGKVFASPVFHLNIDRQFLIISPKELDEFIPDSIQSDQKEYSNRDLQMHFSTDEASGFKISSNKRVGAFDLDKLQFPLTIRKWQKGDHFFPLGMKKKKKLSDFMIDEKIPLNLKERVYLLISGVDIVWVIGQRIDDRFKITGETQRIFKAQISQNHDKSV